MTNNDVLRSLRHILNVSDDKMIEIIRLANGEVSKTEITGFLKREDEEGYLACSDRVMSHFLNGLVLFKRGKDEGRPPQPVEPNITNNVVLKKIRVAFELKDDDLTALVEKAGLQVSKTEMSSFFRKKDHRTYRECGDQFLRNILKGLTV